VGNGPGRGEARVLTPDPYPPDEDQGALIGAEAGRRHRADATRRDGRLLATFPNVGERRRCVSLGQGAPITAVGPRLLRHARHVGNATRLGRHHARLVTIASRAPPAKAPRRCRDSGVPGRHCHAASQANPILTAVGWRSFPSR
jgi:hypothetical protein